MTAAPATSKRVVGSLFTFCSLILPFYSSRSSRTNVLINAWEKLLLLLWLWHITSGVEKYSGEHLYKSTSHLKQNEKQLPTAFPVSSHTHWFILCCKSGARSCDPFCLTQLLPLEIGEGGQSSSSFWWMQCFLWRFYHSQKSLNN